MNSESDSEMTPETHDAKDDDNDRPVPPGWRDPGTGWLRLDPEHPSYPNSQKRHEKGTRKRLKTNPKIIATIETLQERFQPIMADYLRLRRTDRCHGRERPNPAALHYLSNVLPHIEDQLSAAAESCAGPNTAPLHVCLYYLIEQTLLPEIADHLTNPLEPVFLRANASPQAEYVIINPGEMVMRFTGATTRERGEALSSAITQLQTAWGYAQADTGGRPAGPVDEDQAMTVAKLHHWENWPHRKIAAFLGWLRDDEDWYDEKVQRRIEMRVRRWLRIGESLLDAETDRTGTAWRKPPRHMAPLARSRRLRGDPPM